MKRFLAVALAVSGTLLCCFPSRTLAAAAPSRLSSLVIVLLPGTSLRDWQTAQAPFLHQLMQTGSLAVMNTRTAHTPGDSGRETPQSALLTLGAGGRAAAPNATERFFPASMQAPGRAFSCRALFERRTGDRARPDQAVCLNWPSVVAANRNVGYDLKLGSLAETLAAHGIQISAGGGPNADWMAADSHGLVGRAARLKAVPGACLIWDAGSGIEAADLMLQSAGAQVRAAHGRLIVLSPYANARDYAAGRRLTPVLLWGEGIPAGVLSSPSTRRSGLVTNTDFAPSVAADFGVPRTAFSVRPFGFAWSAAAEAQSRQRVQRLSEQSVQQARGLGLLPYFALILAAWILVVTLTASRNPVGDFWRLAPLAVCLAALYAFSAAMFWLWLPASLILIFGLAQLFGNDRVLTALAGIAVLSLAGDLCTGSPLMHQSLLGYSAIEGARYYGIGNEAMGLLLGSALVLTARIWRVAPGQTWPRIALLLLMALLVLLLGSAGAKAGGVLVSLLIFGAFLFTISGQKWTVKKALILGAVMTLGLSVFAVGDAFLLGSHSHLGEGVRRIIAGGGSEGWDIIRRKLAVEGRLAYHSAWAALLWIGGISTVRLWKRAPTNSRVETALRLSGAVGVAACVLLNDAGIVAGALFLVPLWCHTVRQKKTSPLQLNLQGGGLQEPR